MDDKNDNNPSAFIVFLAFNIVVMTINWLDVSFPQIFPESVIITSGSLFSRLIFGWFFYVSAIAFFYVPIKVFKTIRVLDREGGNEKLQAIVFSVGVINELLTIFVFSALARL